MGNRNKWEAWDFKRNKSIGNQSANLGAIQHICAKRVAEELGLLGDDPKKSAIPQLDWEITLRIHNIPKVWETKDRRFCIIDRGPLNRNNAPGY